VGYWRGIDLLDTYLLFGDQHCTSTPSTTDLQVAKTVEAAGEVLPGRSG